MLTKPLQPFLRFNTARIARVVLGETTIPFQPFLRFNWNMGIELGNKIWTACVSTLLEIQPDRGWVPLSRLSYGQFQPFLRFNRNMRQAQHIHGLLR